MLVCVCVEWEVWMWGCVCGELGGKYCGVIKGRYMHCKVILGQCVV